MKKLWLASIALLACFMQVEAQKYLNIYQDGLVIKKISASEVDSISITDRAPYTINLWYRGNVSHTFASEEVDSIKVINEKGGPLSYLGIVGFNSDLYTKNVALLSNSTVSQYSSFIDNMSKKDGTILYYAVDNALNMLEGTDIQTPLTSINFVTFTDGLDQGSIMMNNQYTSSNKYLQAISKRIKDSKYKGLKVNAYAIGLRGTDVSTNDDIEQFRQNLKSLASSDQNAFELTNPSQLEDLFRKIAEKINIVNTRQTVRVMIPGVDDGARVRFAFDGCDADNSKLYIEGTFNLLDYSLSDVTYHGIKARSGNRVQGTKDGIFVTFTFRGLRKDEGDDILPTYNMNYYFRLPSQNAWKHNSEFDINNKTQYIVNYSGTLIILILDCSSSLGSNDFKNMKSYAKNFITTVSKNAMPFTFESPRNVISGLDDYEFAVNVSWDAVIGADHYKIYRSSNGNSNTYELIADNIKSCSWKDCSPLSGNNYYKVCAVGLGMTTGMSSGTNAVNYSLDVPKNVKAEMVANGEKLAVNIQWDAVKYAEAYQVYRSTSSYSNFTLIADSIKATSYKDESELSGKYYYRVRTIGHGAVSPEMNTSAEVNYSLGTPQNVKATQNSENLSINVTWDAVNLAQSYIVYRSSSKNGAYTEIAKDVIGTLWTDKSPINGNNYYKVSAIGYGLTSQMSNRTNSIYSSLNAPNNVKATINDTEFVVNVTWDAVTQAEYYQVYRSPGINTSDYELVADNITSCSWTDASPKVNYNGDYVYYKVYAVSGEITSSASYSTSVYFYLEAPKNIKAELIVNDNKLAVNVSWDVANYAEKYQVYRSNSSSYYANYELIADDVTTNSWVDKSPSTTENNYYRIVTVGHGFTSEKSNSTNGVNMSSMPIPKNVTGEMTLNGSSFVIKVSWDAVKIAEKYQVYRSNSSSYNTNYELIADDVTTNSWIDNSPLSGYNYYKVVAIGYGLTSSQSDASGGVNFSMAAPTKLAGELALNGNKLVIDVTWEAVENAESYIIYRSSNDYDFDTSKPLAENVTGNSWIDTEPIVGSNYYKVQAKGHGLTSQLSSTYADVNCSLSTPTNVKGELVANGNTLAINITWDVVKFAESYNVYRRNTSGSYEVIAKNVSSNSWRDDNPFEGSNYYQIEAVGYGLTSRNSNSVEVYRSISTPSNVIGEVVLNGNILAINLSWDIVKYAESYIIYRSSDRYNFDYNNPVAKDVTSNSWIDNNPLKGDNYYQVVATGYGLTSGKSSWVDVYRSLPAPTNVKSDLVVNGNKLGINVTWDAAPLAESYTIYRTNDNKLIAENVTSTSCIDEAPLEGYNEYRVYAVGYGLTSSSSYTSSANYALNTPSNLKGEMILSDGKQMASLTWNAVDFAESYIIYRSSSSGGTYEQIASGIKSTSWKDETPLDGNNYYKVSASGYGLNSGQSSYTSVTKN